MSAHPPDPLLYLGVRVTLHRLDFSWAIFRLNRDPPNVAVSRKRVYSRRNRKAV